MNYSNREPWVVQFYAHIIGVFKTAYVGDKHKSVFLIGKFGRNYRKIDKPILSVGLRDICILGNSK